MGPRVDGVRRAVPALSGAVALLLGLGAALLPGATASAATTASDAAAPGVTWSVSPADGTGPDGTAWIEQEADPGALLTEYLAVRNLGDAAAVFRLTAADGYFTETGRFNMLQAGEASVAAGTWIDLPAEVAVEAGATAIVPFTIAVPENATPGDHAAGVAASVLSEGTIEDGTRVGVESRVGFRVITRVAGELAPAIALSDLSGDYATSWNPFAPGRMTVGYAAENSGNVQLVVRDRVGGTATDRGEFLPGDRRAITVDSYPQWPLGPVEVEVVLQAEVGGTQLDAAASGVELAPERATLVVWAVPWPQLLLLLGILLLVGAVLLGRRRGRVRLERLLDDAREQGRREAAG